MPDQISSEHYLFIEVRDRVYRYRFTAFVTSVGSGEDNVVRIKEAGVAAHHLLLSYVDGKFFLRRVEDSPVRLNGERIETYSEELRHGDVIGIGDVRLRLAEGGPTSDMAVLLTVIPHVTESVRPFQVFASRKTEVVVGDGPADLVLPGAGRLTIENFGGCAQYLVPPEGMVQQPYLNEMPVGRRTRLKDRDVLRLKGVTLKLRLLRGEVMDDPEALMSIDALTRFASPER